jgi:hypothetical protein
VVQRGAAGAAHPQHGLEIEDEGHQKGFFVKKIVEVLSTVSLNAKIHFRKKKKTR